MTLPVTDPSTAYREVRDYRTRTWWAPVSTLVVTAVSAAQMTAEAGWLGYDRPPMLLAHAISGIVVAIAAGVMSSIRGSGTRKPFLAYSERFLVGLALGIITSVAISIIHGILVADSAAAAVENGGMFLTLSIWSMELPVACVVGGLTWHLLSKARGHTAAPRRARRPIEDPD